VLVPDGLAKKVLMRVDVVLTWIVLVKGSGEKVSVSVSVQSSTVVVCVVSGTV
jgi:hypothetical protein